jgi:hypothetical protein
MKNKGGYSGSFGGVVRKMFRKIWVLILLILDRR